MDRFLFVAGVIALPGRLHYIGGGRRAADAPPCRAKGAADALRDGCWDHAGGQCVEPAPACDRPG